MSGGVRCRVPMLEVNPHVMCVLCGGYFIDATTIIECLHSFCRKCIVTYLESSRFCPICDVQVHKTKPLLSIRPDATLQDIVYKLVPGLYRDEMRRRREFYAARPSAELPCERGEARGEERRAVFAPDEVVEVRLQYCPRGTGGPGNAAPQARFLRCPAVVTVGHLQHMLRCKHELAAGRRVELLARGEVLTPDLMLLDVAYLHCWRRVGPLQLYYRIVTVPLKRRFPSEAVPESAKLAPSSSAAAAARLCPDPPVSGGDAVVVPAIAAESAAVCRESAVNPETRSQPDPVARVRCQAAAAVAQMVALTATTLASVSDTEATGVTTSAPCATKTSSATCVTVTAAAVAPSRPSLSPKTSAPAATSASRAVASGTITTSSGSDSAPHKEVQLHISETGEMSFGGGSGPAAAAHVDILQQACKILDSLETDEHSAVTPEATPQPLPMVSNGQPTSSPSRLKTSIKDSNKNEIILPLSTLADAKPKLPARAPDDTGQKRSPAAKDAPLRSRHGRLHDDSRKRSSPVGYKTLKTPPKSWNPQLPRSYIGAGQKTSTSSASALADGVRTMSPIAPKPPRFFKMRHTASAAAVSGAAAADPARTPLLMRVEPAGLGAVWPGAGDQLLPTGPLIYPHLYATQPLPFLPAAGMFAPPPAHSGVSQLTYTSAPGAFSPLLAPPPPQQHRAALTLKSTSTSSSQKMVLSSRPVPSSAAASGKQRPHVACSVPTSRPRPASAGPAAARLPLGAFMPTAALGLPAGPVPGAPPRLNGHPAAAATAGVQYRPAGEPPPRDGSASPRSKRPRSESASTASGGLLSAPVSLKAPSPAKPPSQRGSESRPSPKPGAPPPPAAKRPGPPSALQPETKAVLPS